MKIGMRTIKTALAAVISVIISGFFGAESPFFAVIAAILTIQVTVADSFEIGKNRILGTLLGALIGIAGSTIAPGSTLGIGAGIILIILVCNKFNWNHSISVASVVFLSIVINQLDQGYALLMYSLSRIVDTVIGIMVGLLVNYFVSPPKLLSRIKEDILRLNRKVHHTLKETLTGDTSQFSDLEQMVEQLNEGFDMLKNDIHIRRTKNVPLEAVNVMIGLLQRVHNHLRILGTLQGKRYVDDVNKDLLKLRYGLQAKDHHAPPDVEEMVYNYHVGRVLEISDEIEKMYTDTFPELIS